ncbi:class I SAM-dependent methyltransferase [Paenibacillus gyeongsangnamensis]|uniref:class I SAM-dependent methyltransferase n=1 Tax=Paenibacillus gyeongsangnamensis TaxID=3388067 RepID=UPI002FD43B0C
MMKDLQEKLLFPYKFTCAPRQIGSVTPSSAWLAEKMLEPVDWNRVEAVAELGAGTGAITRCLDRVKPKRAKGLLFEKDPQLRSRLTDAFPGYSCYEDAERLQTALQWEEIEGFDFILGGLPFFNFP